MHWTQKTKKVARSVFEETMKYTIGRSQRELYARVIAEKQLNSELKKV